MKYEEYQEHLELHMKFYGCYCPMGCKKAVLLSELSKHFNYF